MSGTQSAQSPQVSALEAFAASVGAPPGTIPNFVNPPSIGSTIVIPSLVLIVLTFIFVLARLYCKTFITKALGLDDVFSIGALLCAIARCTISVILVQSSGIGRHLWDIDPTVPGVYDNLRNLQWIEDMIYLLGIAFAKISILVLYVKVFRPKQTFRKLCYIMMAVTASYCTIFIFLYAFNCEPQYYTWHVQLNAPARCMEIDYIIIAIGAVNLVTDLIILIMPIPLILKLNLKPKQKCGVAGVFLTGVFIVATTIARLVIVAQTIQEVDQSYQVIPEIIWLTVELDMGIICGCLPALAPLWTRTLSTNILTSLRNLLPSSLGSRSSASSRFRSKSDYRQFADDPSNQALSAPGDRKMNSSSHNSDIHLVNLETNRSNVQNSITTTNSAFQDKVPAGQIGMQHTIEQHSAPNDRSRGV